MEQEELIDRYIRGELDDLEKREFESRIKNDSNLFNRISLRKLILRGIEENYYSELKQRFNERKSLNKPIKVNSIKLSSIKLIAASVAIFIFCLFVILKVTNETSYQDIASFDPVEMGVPNLMNENQGKKALGVVMTEFKKGNYQEAYADLSKINRSNPSDTIDYFLGVCALRSDQTEKAIVHFEQTLDYNESIYFQKAQYRLALSYLLNGEIDMAQNQLNTIAIDENHSQRPEAIRILNSHFFNNYSNEK